MKQFFKMFFASLLAWVIGGLILFFMVIGIVASISQSAGKDKEKEVDDKSVLVIDSEKLIHELGESNTLAMLSGSSSYSPGLYDIIKSVKQAKEDKNIKGIFLRLGFNPNGWATLHQLRTALEDFRKSGKFIYAYGEMIPQKSYYLASVADSVFINPAGFTELKGLSSELPFFKGTLEKMEIEPQIFYAGKFK
ncbi:MAG: signal peptide peptidase SppA, partial [Sphingobacteriales bacterium]